jgi:hypothetical protein
MRVVLLRSSPEHDRIGQPVKFAALSRGAVDDDVDSIHYPFDFEDYRGETPHVRVSLDAEKGPPSALRLERARKLAAAVDEFWAARPS